MAARFYSRNKCKSIRFLSSDRSNLWLYIFLITEESDATTSQWNMHWIHYYSQRRSSNDIKMRERNTERCEWHNNNNCQPHNYRRYHSGRPYTGSAVLDVIKIVFTSPWVQTWKCICAKRNKFSECM